MDAWKEERDREGFLAEPGPCQSQRHSRPLWGPRTISSAPLGNLLAILWSHLTPTESETGGNMSFVSALSPGFSDMCSGVETTTVDHLHLVGGETESR